MNGGRRDPKSQAIIFDPDPRDLKISRLENVISSLLTRMRDKELLTDDEYEMLILESRGVQNGHSSSGS